MHKKPLKVAILASEAAPFAKDGGLGDVIGSLPNALKALHVEAMVFIPKYRLIDEKRWKLSLIFNKMRVRLPNNKIVLVNVWHGFFEGTSSPIYFLDIPEYFTGSGVYNHESDDWEIGTPFIVFTLASLELMRELKWQPEVINTHDWMTAIACTWLHTTLRQDAFFKNTASVLTIHNLYYQGEFTWGASELLGLTREQLTINNLHHTQKGINVLGSAIQSADVLNTVSPTYAKEIKTREYGDGLNHLLKSKKKYLYGVLNGLDYKVYDPAHGKALKSNYSIDTLNKKTLNKILLQQHFGIPKSSEIPLFAMVSRLAIQKGLDLICDVIPELAEMGAQLVILGSLGAGTKKYKDILETAQKKYPKQLILQYTFDPDLAQQIYAAADIFLMPSRFEPMGLSQIIAMKYGTIPVVRKTGGLADTVQHKKTGFVFKEYNKNAFMRAIHQAYTLWHDNPMAWEAMKKRAMKKDFSWESSSKKYVHMYKNAIKIHKSHSTKY